MPPHFSGRFLVPVGGDADPGQVTVPIRTAEPRPVAGSQGWLAGGGIRQRSFPEEARGSVSQELLLRCFTPAVANVRVHAAVGPVITNERQPHPGRKDREKKTNAPRRPAQERRYGQPGDTG